MLLNVLLLKIFVIIIVIIQREKIYFTKVEKRKTVFNLMFLNYCRWHSCHTISYEVLKSIFQSTTQEIHQKSKKQKQINNKINKTHTLSQRITWSLHLKTRLLFLIWGSFVCLRLKRDESSKHHSLKTTKKIYTSHLKNILKQKICICILKSLNKRH